MKKILLINLMCVLCTCAIYAQKSVTIKAGTIIPLLSVNEVKARDVQEGEMVDFRVAQDIMVDGVCAISQGTLVKGKVVEAQKSTVAGTKGRLVININNLILPDGNPLFFSNSDVRVYGRNRTPVAVVVGLLTWVGFLIPGSAAIMPASYEVQATVAANTNIVIQ